MAKFTKTNNKVSFFKIAQSKYNELLNATADSGNGIIAGAIYFVEDGNVGRIYVNKKCYGEANLTNSVTNVTLETKGENTGKIKVTYSTGDPTYIPLPEGKVYTAGKGIEISDANEISALDEKIGVDLTVTQATGAISKDKKITADTSVKDILLQMLQEVKQPANPTLPKVTVSLSGAGAKEVGSKFTPSYSVSFNPGSYQYGPATGVTATGYSITDGTNTATTATGTFAEITVGDTTNYKVTATATYGDGVVAKDNVGNPSNPEKKISAGTTASASSAAVTGFRSYFYGTKSVGLESYDSAAVRALTNSGKKYVGMFKIEIPANSKQIAFAAPANYTLKSVINVNLSRGEVADTFEKTTVAVEGANGYTAANYNVWVFNSATALDANTFEVTLV